eukprot:TRINITY_DN160_c0_g1_i23.p1 TRINITY_DN160_c0_g1~~TRINITY_DN160_c0_g1_i23.p1  ORF type:complete len:366 (+),score=115.41 TRINITY_DN160_c0_g1_i23:223-1320(+)
MPVMKLRGGGHYFMINMSDKGEEMVESPTKEYSVQLSTLIEEKIADDDASDPVTDVFLVSHGYKTDRQGAVESYANWMNGMIDQLPKETRFHANHGHTRVLIVGIHWPSWMNDGKPYAAGKLLRDLTLVQQILATLRWPDAAPEVLGAIDRMVNAVAYTPTVKEDLMFLIDLSDGIDAPMDLNGLPEEDLLRMGEDLFGKMLNKQQLGQKLEVKQPSAVPHRKMTFKDETAAAATAAAIDSCHHHEEDEAEPQRRGPFSASAASSKASPAGLWKRRATHSRWCLASTRSAPSTLAPRASTRCSRALWPPPTGGADRAAHPLPRRRPQPRLPRAVGGVCGPPAGCAASPAACTPCASSSRPSTRTP